MNEDWIKAGEIAREAREYGKGLIKNGSKLLDVCEKIENRILDLGGKFAFPVDLSVNSMAAHYSPDYNDETKFGKDDMVKIDLGVHINGFVTDTAVTVDLSGKNGKLVRASKEALDEALKIVKVGLEVREIGKVIQEKIQSYGFSPVRNLSGHSVDCYKIHAGLTIPNYDNGNKTKLKKGQVVAIEPFASTGIGKVIEGKLSGVYGLIQKKPVRDNNTKTILEFIDKEYRTLPFCRRWLIKKFSLFQVNFALSNLEKLGVVKNYHLLPEESNGLVSQAEKTIVVDDKILILT